MPESNYTQPDLLLLGDDHVRAYRESGGEVGYLWNGVPTLLLTATGRRTGRKLTSPLIFARDGDDYLIVASMGGAPKPPEVVPESAGHTRSRNSGESDETLPVVAHAASATEKPRLWKIVTDVWPNYDVYQSRTDRDIPVVVLSPT